MSSSGHTFDEIFSLERIIPEDPDDKGQVLHKSKMLFGMMLFLMIAIAALSLFGKSQNTEINLNSEIAGIVDETILGIPEVGLINLITKFDELHFTEDIDPVVMELNLVKYAHGESRINDRFLRDRIIQDISERIEGANLGVYAIIDIKFNKPQ